MSLESQVLSSTAMSPQEGFWLVAKVGILILSILYFIFSLIVIRQVYLMTNTLITESAPALRAFAIIHAGFALGLIILFIGFLFG
ncbi:MAG: DUF5657 family protein [Candidatus Daviesbacteria bacterium]